MAIKHQNRVVGIIFLVLAVICGAILLDRMLGSNFVITPEFIYPIALLILFSGGLRNAFRKNPGGSFRIVLGWIMVFAALVFGYDMYQTYKVNQIAERTQGVPPDYIIQKRGAHFYTDVWVNGVKLSFMVDSGATLVVLTKENAQKVGIDVDKITDYLIVSTANGEKMEKTTYVREMKIGEVVFKDVRIAVSEEGLDQNLLGNSFMKNFSQKLEVGNELRLWK